MKTTSYRLFKRAGTAAALVLAVMLAALCVDPQAVYAIEFFREASGDYVTEEDKDGYYYRATEEQLAAGECFVYLYGGKKADIVLPKTCGSCRVTGIDTNFSSLIGFLGNSLSTVKIPKGYTAIESGDGGRTGAFQNQDKLYRVEIPKSVTQIGEHVFDGCDFSRLTIVTPRGSAAESYAVMHGILCTNSKKLKVDFGKKIMAVGEKRMIAVYNNPNNIQWKSSDASVAKVDANGMVTANKPGKVTITAKIGKKSYRCKFTVGLSK